MQLTLRDKRKGLFWEWESFCLVEFNESMETLLIRNWPGWRIAEKMHGFLFLPVISWWRAKWPVQREKLPKRIKWAHLEGNGEFPVQMLSWECFSCTQKGQISGNYPRLPSLPNFPYLISFVDFIISQHWLSSFSSFNHHVLIGSCNNLIVQLLPGLFHLWDTLSYT